MAINEYFCDVKKYDFSIEKCPVCGGKLYNVYGANFVSCCDCNVVFVKKFVLDTLSFIPIQIKAFEYDVKIEPRFSDIKDNKISLYLDVKPKENKEEKENERITNDLSKFGYSAENFPPTYTPIKIVDGWYVFGDNSGIRIYKDCGEIHTKLLYYDKGCWFVGSSWYDNLELEELGKLCSFVNNLIKDGKLK